MQEHQETLDSAVSYTLGTGTAAVGLLVEISNTAQAIAIILGCAVVAIRLAHDLVKFMRYLKEKK